MVRSCAGTSRSAPTELSSHAASRCQTVAPPVPRLPERPCVRRQGCCVSMESEVPELILPDPTPETANTFYCKKVGLFSRDFEVYKDAERELDKWLVIDTEGGLFDDNAYVCVENYVRPPDGKIGEGQCLCYAKMDKLDYDNYIYYDGEVDVDSDDSDYSTDSSDGEEDVDVLIVKQKTKWKCKTKVKFYVDKTMGVEVGELKVKAKGKAKKKDTLVRTEMEDGSVEERHEIETSTKVKKFFYKLQMADGSEIPIQLDGNWNKGDHRLQWSSPFFEVTIGGFIKPEPTITTFDGAHPALWLMIGFVTAVKLSPTDVKSNCSPPFFHV
jgi:hypothetical protein